MLEVGKEEGLESHCVIPKSTHNVVIEVGRRFVGLRHEEEIAVKILSEQERGGYGRHLTRDDVLANGTL